MRPGGRASPRDGPTRVSEERARLVGHNEALYRHVNERIDDLNDALGAVDDELVIICECGDLKCAEQITVARDVYESTRANPSLFVLRPGHQAEDVEFLVERAQGYVVVEKRPG